MGSSTRSAAPRLGRDQLTGRHQALFIGQANGFAGLHRFVGGLQAGDTDDGADHKIHLRMSRGGDRAGLPQTTSTSVTPAWRSRPTELPGGLFQGYRNQPRTPAEGLLEDGLEIVSRRQRDYAEAVGI